MRKSVNEANCKRKNTDEEGSEPQSTGKKSRKRKHTEGEDTSEVRAAPHGGAARGPVHAVHTGQHAYCCARPAHTLAQASDSSSKKQRKDEGLSNIVTVRAFRAWQARPQRAVPASQTASFPPSCPCLSSSMQAAATQVVNKVLRPMLLNFLAGDFASALRTVGGCTVLKEVNAADGEDGYMDVRFPLPKRRLQERASSCLLEGVEDIGRAGVAAGRAGGATGRAGGATDGNDGAAGYVGGAADGGDGAAGRDDGNDGSPDGGDGAAGGSTGSSAHGDDE